MRPIRLDFIWLCYMVISVKGVELWSARLFLSPHSAQNPLDMDSDWMHANLGITKYAGSMVNCGINLFVKHQEIQMSQMLLRGNTKLQMSSQLYGLIQWYPCVHNSYTYREIQSLKSRHENHLSHSGKPHHWWTSRHDIRNGASNHLTSFTPLASKSPILLSVISMFSCVQKLASFVLMLVEK